MRNQVQFSPFHAFKGTWHLSETSPLLCLHFFLLTFGKFFDNYFITFWSQASELQSWYGFIAKYSEESLSCKLFCVKRSIAYKIKAPVKPSDSMMQDSHFPRLFYWEKSETVWFQTQGQLLNKADLRHRCCSDWQKHHPFIHFPTPLCFSSLCVAS